MISDGTRKLNLYEFFSVLIPGTSFLLALTPFLPKSLSGSGTVMLLFMLIGGFVVGHALHMFAIWFEDFLTIKPTHREFFTHELRDGERLSSPFVEEFKDECDAEFPFLDDGEIGDAEAEDLYALARSYIHMDGRGRARTFQATYAFSRTMWAISLLVAGIYYSYAISKYFGLFEELVPYESHLGSFGFEPVTITVVSAAVGVTGAKLFSRARNAYQENYVRYLIADFLVLQGVDYPETVLAAEDIESVTRRRMDCDEDESDDEAGNGSNGTT